jgi:hypothetical protein
VIRARSLFRSALLLAFALTLAQVGALAHGYSHVKSDSGGPDRTAVHAWLCGDCATFGAVLIPGSSPSFSFTLPVASRSDAIDTLFLTRSALALRHYFQAQGPPVLR